MGGGIVEDENTSLTPDQLRDKNIKVENMKAFSTSEAKAAEDIENSSPFFGLFDRKVSVPNYLNQDEREAVQEEFKLAKNTLYSRKNEWHIEQDKAHIEKRKPDLSIKFVYAWTLLNSERVADRTVGKQLMGELISKGDIKKGTSYGHDDECIYTMAQSCYMCGEIGEARQYCETLLRMTPDSARAQKLHAQIRYVQSKEQEANIETAAVAGALVLGFAGIALAIASGGGKK